MFLLQLLGGASLEGPSGPVSGRAAQRHRLLLLAILALEHPRGVGRDRLICWLWPEHPSADARHLLRDSLYLLRHALGEDSLLSTGDELRLNPQRVRCDVWKFEESLSEGRREAAVDLYGGPLLEGFHGGGASELEHWLDGWRDRLARAHAGALEWLAEDASARGDAAGAAGWWRRLAAGDPYNSRIALRLMEALEAAGDRAGALQHARVHTLLLEQEFGAAPDPGVDALAERLRTRPSVVAGAGQTPQDAAAERFEAPGPADRTEAGIAQVADVSASAARGAHWLNRRRGLALGVVVACLAVAMMAGAWLLPVPPEQPVARATAPTTPRSIAVLPCANRSRDPGEDYFSDGLTDELTGTLSRLSALRVAARTSVFALEGTDRDVREIGALLDVGTVLECSVRRAGGRTRVTAQLISTADGFHLWAETYEREGTDVFAIQKDLALQIVDALQAQLTSAERGRIGRRPTTDSEAYELYLKGRYFWNQRTPGGNARAVEYLTRAIETDPRYAQAYAGLATVYSMQGLAGEITPAEATERTRAYALQALELDPDVAEAHTVLGGYFHAHTWDSDAAEREHRRALELDPNYSTAHHWYGNFLSSVGRFEEAVAHKRKALEIDPLSPHLSVSLGGTLLDAGRADEALEHFRSAIELDSTYWRARSGLAAYYSAVGRSEEAVRTHRRAVVFAGADPVARAGLARALAIAGQEDEAREIVRELRAEGARTGLYAPAVAAAMLALGDPDDAIDWLERAYRQRHPGLRFMGGLPFADLKDDPRYRDLRRRVGLPP